MNQKYNFCNELNFMINEARYLSKEYEEQYDEMEEFARWNLPEEIGLGWVDAKGIIYSKELAQAISDESLQMLKRILYNFENAFQDSDMAVVWSHDAMKLNEFWEEQRNIAKQFLDSICFNVDKS